MDPDLDPKRRHSIDKTVAIPTNHENPNHRNIFNEITLFWEINGLFQNEISANRIARPTLVKFEGNRHMFPDKPEEAEEKYSAGFSKSGSSKNMTELSNKKIERHAAQILTTKSHEKYVDEPRLDEEIRMNPIMKDLIINRYVDEYNTQVGVSKRKKQRKEEAKAGTIKSIEENHPSWVDTLKE
jgi:hypothetical protein